MEGAELIDINKLLIGITFDERGWSSPIIIEEEVEDDK